MDEKNSSSSAFGTHEASNHDELFMKQSMHFSNNLRDMKNLRKQLYSAAEYYEKAYSKEDQKQIVIETLKDYAIKALINTIDHLGSVAFKVNSFFDEKVGDVSALELRFSCLEQRLKTSQEYISYGGLSQQLLVVQSPKYHKRYIFPLPADETFDATKFHRRSFSIDCSSHQFKTAVRAAIKGSSPFLSRGESSGPQSSKLSSKKAMFTFAANSIEKRADKRASSPQRFPLLRSGTVLPKRSTSPNHPKAMRRYPSEPRRSGSLAAYSERERGNNELETYSNKSKGLFKALLSMRKTNKDRTFYKYMDED